MGLCEIHSILYYWLINKKKHHKKNLVNVFAVYIEHIRKIKVSYYYLIFNDILISNNNWKVYNNNSPFYTFSNSKYKINIRFNGRI